MGPLWLSDADVASLIDLPDAITVVGDAFASQAAGRAGPMAKTYVNADGVGLHAMGGILADVGIAGAKAWAHTSAGAAPVLLLWDLETGSLRACIEAFVLGQLRTGAVTAVATARLAEPGANTLAVIGTGKQALPQAAAVAAVRRLERITVVGRNPEWRDLCRRRLEKAGLSEHVEATDVIATAVNSSSVVVTATRSQKPLVLADMVGAGTHVNAIGAITPDRREIAPDLVADCDLVVADDPDAARTLSVELEAAATVVPLSQIVAGEGTRPRGAVVTLFKAMGVGIADVAVGAAVLERASRAGVGRQLPGALPTEPTLTRGPRQ